MNKITNSREIRTIRENFLLNPYQKDILAGTLLGDGGLYADGWSKNYRLQVIQGNKQKEYLFWKFDAFRNCCVSSPSYQKWNDSWRIRTISHSQFNGYARAFYSEGRKIVPKDIANLLTPLSVAIWFMDDGVLGSRGDGYVLNTQNFTDAENAHLKFCLEDKFSLDVSIHADKRWWRLYIRKGSMAQFKKIIEPYMIPSMKYKLQLLTP